MPDNGSLNILYLVHDLSDPAVHKRVVMLKDGGAQVTLAGFRREAALIDNIAGSRIIHLGQTHNGRFLHRIWSVIREVLHLAQHRDIFAECDVIIARNLEMLGIAVRGRSLIFPPPRLVYECLDIHRLMLNRGLPGKMLRRLEGWLSKRAQLLITSSPAFVQSYFNRLSNVRLHIKLLENKVYQPGALSGADTTSRPAGPPWRIGWFGAIRCQKSLQILSDLARLSNGRIEVIIRGRPALDQFEDFYKTTSVTPGLQFLGPYKNPDDLEAIYRDVHFTWAIDMFEEGQNSAWLLPNRLYEGGLNHCVAIAQDTVETGNFLKRLDIGVTITDPYYLYLTDFFNTLTPEQYWNLEQAAIRVPLSTWGFTSEDCKALVEDLKALPSKV